MAKITGANVIKINYNPVCLKECVRIKMVHLEPRKRGICQGWLYFFIQQCSGLSSHKSKLVIHRYTCSKA